MGLNIKNEQTVQLIRQLAGMMGVNQVTAVTVAVRDKILEENTERLKSGGSGGMSKYERMMSYANEFSRRVPKPLHSWEVDGLLYGEDGLPK